MNIADLSKLIENMIRIGTVLEVDLTKPRCRVKSGDLETDWLRMPSQRAGRTRKWDPLTVGEQVMVISPSGVIEAGFVIPLGIFSDAITPPSDSADVEMTQYPDGAVMSYNHSTSELSITGIKLLNIASSGDVMVTNDGDLIAHCKGAAKITADGIATVKAQKIKLIDGDTSKGVVQGDCLCTYTGAPHPHLSKSVEASA